MSRFIAVTVAAAMGAGLLVTAMPAQAAGAWSAPVQVSAPGLPANRPAAWLGPDGRGAIAMQVGFEQVGGTYSVQVADRRANGTWDAPVVLSTAGIDSYAPVIAGNGNHLVCAAWNQEVGAGRQARASCKDGDAAWGSSSGVDILFGGITDMDIAVAPDGRVALVVLGYSQDFRQQRASVSTYENGSWSDPQTVISGNAQGAALLSGVEVEALADSAFVLTWHGAGGLASSWLNPNSILWTQGEVRSAVTPLSVSLVSSGDTATLLWSQNVAGDVSLQGAQWRGEEWGIPTSLHDFGAQAPAFSATAGLAGVVAVTWAETTFTGNTVQAIVVPSFSVPPVAGIVVTSTPPMSGPIVAPDGHGSFYVAYQAGRRASQSIRVTHFSVSSGRIDPGTSEAISPVADADVNPAALLNAGSALLAAWTRIAPGAEAIMASSVDDPAPPRRVRASSKKRGQITVTWRAPAGGSSGYVVQVRRGNGAWMTKGNPAADATAWTWKRARSGADYQVRMASTRGSVTGDWSRVARVTAK